MANIFKASVTGLGNSSPTSQVYTRDDNFPTSFEEVTDSLGNIFIKIPTMYRKIDSVVDNQITAFTMSTAKVDDTYEPYSVFVKPNGEVMPYVLIGKYCYNSTSSANSTSSGSASLTIGNARNYARKLGEGYQQYDWQFQKLFVDLYLLISQTVNITNVNNYLGVYNLDGSIWIDGIARNNTTWCMSYDPSKYVDSAMSSSDGYVAVNYNTPTTKGCIKKLGYDETNPFLNYPSEIIDVNDQNNIYYCDANYYYRTNTPVSSIIGLNTSYKDCGLWHCSNQNYWSATQTARLCYRPLDETVQEETKTKIIIKNPITIFNKVEEINGVPIEIPSLDSSFLVAENEGKVYKYNGKLYRVSIDKEFGTIVDLTGATVTVPSGWSATSGYGIFSLNGSINIIDTSDTYSYNLYGSGNSSNFYIGYNSYNSANRLPDAKADSISYRDSDGVYSAMYSYSSYSFSLVITGGSSATNQSLIQWFVDNNATIEGGVYEYNTYNFQEILSPSGTLEVTANGEVDVKTYEKVNVNVGIEEVATETEMNALLVEANIGKVYRFTGTTGTYTNGDLYEVVSE